jgi:hypothetical protein
MSREQAYGLLHTLQRTLEQSQPRQLPPPKPSAQQQQPKPQSGKNSQDKQ